jgi:hypothetical protein
MGIDEMDRSIVNIGVFVLFVAAMSASSGATYAEGVGVADGIGIAPDTGYGRDCGWSDSGNCSPSGLPKHYNLTVINGTGSGAYAAGEVVHLFADTQAQTEVFDRWDGDAQWIEDAGEWHTRLIMPAHDTTLTATSHSSELVLDKRSCTGVTNSLKTFYYHIPTNPRGLILFNHGTWGDSEGFISNVETYYVALLAASQGYGVLVPEAEEAAVGDSNGDGKIRWDASLDVDNLDLANLNAVLASLRGNGAIAPETPLYALGMSNGGSFSISLGAVSSDPVLTAAFPHLRFNAVVSYCASGNRDSRATLTPTAYHMCGEDDHPQVSNDKAWRNSRLLAARGVDSVYLENAPSPLYDTRFSRIPGIDNALSTALSDELRNAGLVADDGLFNSDWEKIQSTMTNHKEKFPYYSSLSFALQHDVDRQIRVMLAAHNMYSDLAATTLAFFAAH